MLLCPFAFVKVFIFVIGVLIRLVAGKLVDGSLLEVAVQEARDDLNNDSLETALARHVECHGLEEDALPQVVEFACVELDGGVGHLVAQNR